MRDSTNRGARDASVDSEGSEESAQVGVKRLEAIASTWTTTGLFMAYFGVALLAFVTSLESQTTTNLSVFATSSFSSHSLVATVGVVQGVVLSVAKPPMSKIADVFGRLEAFSLSILLYVVGCIQQAAANNVKTYAAAQVFYAAGVTGVQILMQIFIADTSDLLNRVLCSLLPNIPFLVNVWVGPWLAEAILRNTTWRWGYGIWTVALPIAFLPLALSLALNQRKASRLGLLPRSRFGGLSTVETAKAVWYELDIFGLLLICGAFSLILIPLTLAGPAGLGHGIIIAMLALGAMCLIAFPFWERSERLAPRAFFPRDLFRQRTVLAGIGFTFFYFMAFYLSVFPYFQSYLLVVQGETVSSAGHIVQTFTFTSTITGLLTSLLIKWTRRYKYFIVLGSVTYVSGLALMMWSRREGSSRLTIVGTQIVVGIGGGLSNWPAQLGVQASASHQEVASATAVFLTMMEIGGAIGNAISGAIWTANLPQKLSQYLPAETQSQAEAIYGNVSLAATKWPMGTPTRTAINRAYQETMTKILIVAVCVAMPCVVLSFFMKNYKLDEMDQNVKGVVIGGMHDTVEAFERGADSRRSSDSVDNIGSAVDAQEQEQRKALLGKDRHRHS